MFGRGRCLAHLHGQTACSHTMDDIYGGVLALSEFIRDDYLKTSSLDRQHAYILHNCIDTARFTPRRARRGAARLAGVCAGGLRCAVLRAAGAGQGHPQAAGGDGRCRRRALQAADRGQPVFRAHAVQPVPAQAGTAGPRPGRPCALYRVCTQREPARLLPPGRPGLRADAGRGGRGPCGRGGDGLRAAGAGYAQRRHARNTCRAARPYWSTAGPSWPPS